MEIEITINHDKCKTPIKCRMCLQICPQCIFKLHPTNIKKFEEIPPEHWELHIAYPGLCAGCMECVKICPERAIRVRLAKDETKEAAAG